MKKSTKGTLRMLALGIITLVVITGIMALSPAGHIWPWLVRGAALVGYIAMFLAILSSAYMRELYRLFGRPFLWGHHVLSITGLSLLALHPLAFALETANIAVFVPKFDSWQVFFQLGGRLALYLMWVAALGAALRKTWRPHWRTLHMFNYVAFLLGTIHGILIGTDLGRPLLQGVAIAMALTVIFVFIRKRLGTKRRKSKKAH